MKARKWTSNAAKVIEAAPEENRATELRLNDKEEPIVKALGITWNTSEDRVAICTGTENKVLPMTKRNVLKKIAGVFDPLGFTVSFVMKGKMLLQELWFRGYDWDDIIKDDIVYKIGAWLQHPGFLSVVKVPRCLRDAKPVVSKEIVTFVDASMQAYGAASYLCYHYEDDTISSRLIASKSKVAPLKPITVPRLELMSAVLGLRLTQRVATIIEISLGDGELLL